MSTTKNTRILILTTVVIISLILSVFIDTSKANAEETVGTIDNINEAVITASSVTTTKEVKKATEKTKGEEENKEEAYFEEDADWESIGSCRITTYCAGCNDPAGSYQSSSGVTLYEGCVACNWLPIGTRLRIDGCEYVVMDTCGTDAIDIFVDTSYCVCSSNYYTEVFIYNK